jgi:glycosyltransferase involved in cell wall biosynthesis
MVKISVVIPAYNCARYIDKCLGSILSQSLPKKDYEVIVVNDASTDATKNVLSAYEKQVRIINNRSNKGLIFSLNKGVRAAKGRYIMRLDADDYVDRNLLSSTLKVAETSSCDCIYTDRYETSIRSRKQRYIRVGPNNLFDMIGCGILFKKEIFKSLGLYDDLLFEEYDFMLRLAKEGFKWYYLQKPLYYYVKHGSNMTLQKHYWQKGWEQLLKKWGREELRKWVDIQVSVKGRSRFLQYLRGV